MDDSSTEDILQRIRDVLDSSIDENTAHTLSSEKESGTSGILKPVAAVTSTPEYIDVDDYCKFLKDCREEALALAPLDSRTLITPQQAKQDSQQTPHSLADFHNRIESFDVKSWSQKPDCVSAFECARYGWKLTEWGFLSCVTCKQILHVPSQVSKYKGIDWALRLRKQMESSGHLPTCPWTRIPSPADIVALPRGDTVQKYLTEAVASFKKVQKYPRLSGVYHAIMSELDLNWVRDLTSSAQQHYDIVDEDVTQDMMRDLAVLLAISGWHLKEGSIISCSLCLRETNLELYYDTPVDSEDSVESSVDLSKSVQEGTTSRRTLDPVKNHWSWCPWRRFLSHQSSESQNTSHEGDPNKSLEVHHQEKCDVSDYHRLLEMFREQYESLQFRYEYESSGNTSGRELLKSVSALMDEFLVSTDYIMDKSESSASASSNGSGLDILKTGSKREHSSDAEDGVPAKRSRPF